MGTEIDAEIKYWAMVEQLQEVAAHRAELLSADVLDLAVIALPPGPVRAALERQLRAAIYRYRTELHNQMFDIAHAYAESAGLRVREPMARPREERK